MKVKGVAHLAYYMFAAVGVAAESTGDAMALRLNALEELVAQMMLDNDVKEEAINNLRGDNTVLRDELISMRSRRTTSATSLDKCLEVKGKKLVIKCKTDFSKPALFKKPVRITNDVRVIKGNLMVSNGGNNFSELNGKGNLVIGAREVSQIGAHNIVIGTSHTFSSYGGLVLGENNTISGPFSVVSGGWLNTASGTHSAVSDGWDNIASGPYSVVSGGYANTASGYGSAVSGGRNNTASGLWSAVSGGQYNIASGDGSVVSGGRANIASSDNCAVSGGAENEANGRGSTVIGGYDIKSTDVYSVVGQNP